MNYHRTIGVAFAFVVLISGFSYSLATPKTKHSVTLLPLDPVVKTGVLPNGFTYYIRKNSEPKNRVTLYLANKVGSILETDAQQGLAHFMEHMNFNGSRHFPKNELVSYLEKSGVRFGSDLNAYTGFDETVYQLPLPTDDPALLANGFQIMRDWANEALLDSTEIEKERGVVLEEKRLRKSASQRLQEQYMPLLFNHSRYSERIPIGKENILTGFKRATLLDYYRNWYRPNLQALIVVGDVDVAATEQTILQLFSDLKNPEHPLARTKYTIPLTGKNQFFNGTDKELTSSSIQVMIKREHRVLKSEDDYRQVLVQNLFNSIIAERFADLAKKPGLPYINAQCSLGGFMSNIDAFSANVNLRSGEAEKGFKAVWTEIERVRKFGFTQTELDRARQVMTRNMESALKEKDKTSSENYTEEYLQLFLTGEASPGIDYEYALYKKFLPQFTVADVNAFARQVLVASNRDVLVTGPDKDAADLPAKEVMERWMKEVTDSNITPYVDSSVSNSLLDKKPQSGRIVKETQITSLGLTQLTLSNGIKINLKPTDFKNDEIRFAGFSDGGTSLYSDAEYESASRAAEMAMVGGVGNFSLLQLSKYLSGKKVSVSPFVRERFQGISGYASPQDIETALQLTYLYCTQPRKDRDACQELLTKARAQLTNRNNDPMAAYADTIYAVLSDHNIRRTGPSFEKLDRVNIDRAFEIYKERFANAGNFTFTFVGSFDPEQIKPLIAQYLGSLPVARKVEEARDVNPSIPSGRIEKSVLKGKDQKSMVQMVFSGDFAYSDSETKTLSALADLLTIKLMEALREDESGVYGVSVRPVFVKYPHNRYSLTISFGCAPANVEKLIASALTVVRNSKNNAVSPVDVQKVIAEDLRSNELAVKDNSFWLNYIGGQLQNNEDLMQILSYKESMSKITPEVLQKAANSYLNEANYIRLVLFPEKGQ